MKRKQRIFEVANELISQGLEEMGAKLTPQTYGAKGFTINTKYGELLVILDNPRLKPREKEETIACYSRFLDVERAKQGVSCNPYTGKWNWVHWAADYTGESFAELVLNDIRNILP